MGEIIKHCELCSGIGSHKEQIALSPARLVSMTTLSGSMCRGEVVNNKLISSGYREQAIQQWREWAGRGRWVVCASDPDMNSLISIMTMVC